MKQFVHESVNAQRLLTLGDLDIRGIAAKDNTLTANEYFSRVAQFVEQAPLYAAALADGCDLALLDEIGSILTEIGYNKLRPDIDDIKNAIINGEQSPAEKRAYEIAKKFNALYERTKSAYSVKRFKNAQIEGEQTEEPDAEVSLEEALEYMDYEEAHRKLRILAVDDVAIVLNTITSVLSKHYEVFALTKVSHVESFLRYTTPELFLLDIEMPEMNGYDLVPVIRSFEEHKDTPIIFLTGNASLENLKTAVSLGACDFITKPINPSILLEKIGSKIVRKKAF